MKSVSQQTHINRGPDVVLKTVNFQVDRNYLTRSCVTKNCRLRMCEYRFDSEV
jgi:hypothetical protein